MDELKKENEELEKKIEEQNEEIKDLEKKINHERGRLPEIWNLDNIWIDGGYTFKQYVSIIKLCQSYNTCKKSFLARSELRFKQT